MERKNKGTDQSDLLTAMMKEDINSTQVKIRGVKDTHSLSPHCAVGCSKRQQGRHKPFKIAEKTKKKIITHVNIDYLLAIPTLY